MEELTLEKLKRKLKTSGVTFHAVVCGKYGVQSFKTTKSEVRALLDTHGYPTDDLMFWTPDYDDSMVYIDTPTDV